MELKDFKIAVLTISDRSFKGERPDMSGVAIVRYLENAGYRVMERAIVPDEGAEIEKKLVELSDVLKMDLVITTGGTGLSQRDITPETTLKIATKPVPGISEAIRAYGLVKTGHAMLSRGVSVIRNQTLIINFAGSPKACNESLDAIIEALPHALGLLRGEKLDS